MIVRPSKDDKVYVRADVEAWEVNSQRARELAENSVVRVEPGDPLRITSISL